MSDTMLINIFAWSILGGLLHACQIVIHLDELLFHRIVMHCFWPWFLWIYEECFWALKILFFSFGILQLLLIGTCWVKDWGVVIRNPGEMYCWNDQGHWLGLGTRVWSLYGFEILQGIAESPIVFFEDERCICIALWWMQVEIANHAKNSMK